MLGNSPVVRLFGKTREGKTVCAFYKNYFPYFYILSKKRSKAEEFLKKEFNNLVISIEDVKKYLPIGYQKEKTELIKITLKDPSKVPEVRDAIKREKIADDMFEADILFKYRFMSDFGLSGLKWIKVSGNPTKTITVKTDLVITAETIENTDEEGEAELKLMALDIETISEKEDVPDSKKDIIAMISFSFFPHYKKQNSLVLTAKPVKTDKKNVICFANEKSMLEEFLKIIESFDPDIILGYNVNNFDFPYIIDRLRENKLSLTMGRCKEKQFLSKKLGVKYRNSMIGRTIVDVYDLIRESIQKGSLRLKRLGLGDVSRELLNDDKIDIMHSEISKYWNGNEEQIKKLVEYARKDAELVMKLLLEKNMLDKFFALTKVSGVLLQDCLDGGEAVRLENLLLREFNKKEFVLPCKPDDVERRTVEREKKELKGALVLEPKTGLHTSCVVYLDFRAMYPSIFISYNICPTTIVLTKEDIETIKTPYGAEFVLPKIREGIISGILKYLIKERDKVKAQMKSSRDESEKRNLDAKQYALKIMANAFYGYTGYLRARLYVLDIANAITSCGRDIISKTKEVFEKVPDCEVVYGDTDSVMIKTKTNDLDEAFSIGKNLEGIINKELKGIVEMKIENVFKTLLILSKKRYAGLTYEKVDGNWKEGFVMKGIETVRRDWCDLTTKTLFEVLNILLKEQNSKKAFKFVKEIMVKLQNNQIPIEDLVITKSISKSLSSYKGVQPHVELVKKMRKRAPAEAPGVGDRVSFVIVKGLQLMSDRAEDPDWIKRHGLPVDPKYYIESQILPPLERVFEVIGINKSELAGMGKQLVLGDAIKNHLKLDSVLNTADGFICNKCNQIYRRVPLIGKCLNCQGELLFVSNGTKARYLQYIS
jgi:DNA polymerase I